MPTPRNADHLFVPLTADIHCTVFVQHANICLCCRTNLCNIFNYDLNDFFSSVFTREDDAAVPTLSVLTDEKLEDVDVSVDTICSRLCKLKVDKAAGDDGMTPRILKPCATRLLCQSQ